MAGCEKCWRDADGDSERYVALINERKDNPCTPEEQAGDGATVCPKCHHLTMHVTARQCMNCKYREPYKSVPVSERAVEERAIEKLRKWIDKQIKIAAEKIDSDESTEMKIAHGGKHRAYTEAANYIKAHFPLQQQQSK